MWLIFLPYSAKPSLHSNLKTQKKYNKFHKILSLTSPTKKNQKDEKEKGEIAGESDTTVNEAHYTFNSFLRKTTSLFYAFKKSIKTIL